MISSRDWPERLCLSRQYDSTRWSKRAPRPSPTQHCTVRLYHHWSGRSDERAMRVACDYRMSSCGRVHTYSRRCLSCTRPKHYIWSSCIFSLMLRSPYLLPQHLAWICVRRGFFHRTHVTTLNPTANIITTIKAMLASIHCRCVANPRSPTHK